MTIRTTALIFGAGGQDGSYLAELLLRHDYCVYAVVPYRATPNHFNLQHVQEHPNFFLHYGDITNQSDVVRLIEMANPDEVYNLAAQSFVGRSWNMVHKTHEVNFGGLVNILEAVVNTRQVDNIRVYQASTSEIFGNATTERQTDEDRVDPCNPYGVSKAAAHLAAKSYRDRYDMFVSCGILFNHESPRRPEEFLSQKVAKAVVNIANGNQDKLHLGNLAAIRDWGWAPEYVATMRAMLQLSQPHDIVIGTGEAHTAEEFVRQAFAQVGLNADDHVAYAPALARPNDVRHSCADTTKAESLLGWLPSKKFTDVVAAMVGYWKGRLNRE